MLSFKQKYSAFAYNMVYIPGKEHVGPDITFCYPGAQGNQEDLLVHDNGCYTTSLQMNYCLKNAVMIGDTVDAMSLICNPDNKAEKDESEELEISTKMATMMLLKSFEMLCWEDIREACPHKEETQEIVRAIKRGFPKKRLECFEQLKRYGIVVMKLTKLKMS